MAGASSEYVVGKRILGSAISEVRVDNSNAWYNGIYTDIDNEYILRGGVDITGNLFMLVILVLIPAASMPYLLLIFTSS